MTSHNHKRILKAVEALGQYPADVTKRQEWLSGTNHLEVVRQNATDDELILYALNKRIFIHSVAVPDENLVSIDKSDLLNWGHNPYTTCASVWCRPGKEEHIGFERGISSAGASSLEGGRNFVFIRNFEGWCDEPTESIELLQEFEHTAQIRWRDERHSYCKIDENGDFEDVVSVTRKSGDEGTLLISAKQDSLSEYLVASRQTLVQMFEFLLLDFDRFNSWGDGPEYMVEEHNRFFWHEKIVPGECASHRGVHILKPKMTNQELFEKLSNTSPPDDRGVEFIAHDWRHKEVRSISTAPGATTSYFDMEHNDLPHELSPVFFRPDVLAKYKADRDKYTVGDRDIYCRSSWSMRGIDVNEAGQVHAYICDLADLPYQEQLHWKAYNVEPKAPISKRALANDFKGEWWTEPDPFRTVLLQAREWQRRSVPWWALKDKSLLDRSSLPVGQNRGEWAETFMDLTKLFNEGFSVRVIGDALQLIGVEFEPNDQSLRLLERLIDATSDSDTPVKLNGLRTAQQIRSKVRGHAGSSDAVKLAKEALRKHETFARHVQHVSAEILEDLEQIESAFDKAAPTP